MRVALAIAGPYPALRGSQVLVGQLARGLRARGHEVMLVTYGRHLGDRPGLRPERLVLDAVLALRLWRCVRGAAVDLIHAHNYEAALAGLLVARATGRPLVYHGHSALAEELPTYARGAVARRWLGRLGRLLDGAVPRRADFCIAVTEELGARLRRAGVPATDLACIAPASVPEEVARGVDGGPAAADALVCYAGNLDGYQNLRFLVDVFARVRARLPRARLVLVTHEGAAAVRAAPGVEVLRVRSYGEVRRRLATAHVAVCPRTERSGFPMKLLNYMAAGKAIVAAAGSAKGLRDGVTGRIVPDGDAAAFAAAIVELLGDPAERARLGAAARRAVESPAAWEQVLQRIESIYQHVLARRPPRLVPVACTE
ncbi:MAG TPA: glycosyltransferase family 4 protein [Candidatus Binatia bacterium]|nr:glycosyltransferase family 4 protein [Candidatus Binatia bacterium]